MREFLTTLMAHNAWATGVLLDDAARLSLDDFHRRFEIGPGSIHDTLRHIVGAMLRWGDRIGGVAVRPSIEAAGRRFSAAELREHLAQGDAELRRVAERLEAAGGWTEIMEFAVPDGPTYRFRRSTAMLHVLTHGMHHRAQVLNMRRQLGLAPLGLDLDVVEWECASTGQIAT